MSSNSSANSLNLNIYTHLISEINAILPLATVVIGTIGACTSLSIFSDKRFMATSFAFYSLALCILDLLIIYVGSFRQVLKAYNIDLVTISVVWCKFFIFATRTLLETSIWIKLMVTIDRYLFIHYQKRFVKLTKTRVQFVIIAMLTVFFLCINSPVLVFNGFYKNIQTAANKTIATIVCSFDSTHPILGFINDIGFLFLFCILPFIIMLYLTISMSVAFIKLKEKVQKMSKEKRKEYRFAFSVIFQNILFLISTLPFCALIPVMSLIQINAIQIRSDIYGIIQLCYYIFNSLLFFYFSVKFFIYLFFNSLFREIFYEKSYCFSMRKSVLAKKNFNDIQMPQKLNK